MQSDVINAILAVEDRAQQMIADASASARTILSDADSKASQIVKDAVADEREQGAKAIEAAEACSSETLQNFEADLKQEQCVASILTDEQIEAMADKIVNRVCSSIFNEREGRVQ